MNKEPENKDIPKIFEAISPKMDKIRAKYPIDLEGLEPALTTDIAELIKWYMESPDPYNQGFAEGDATGRWELKQEIKKWAEKKAIVIKHHGYIDLDLSPVVKLEDLLAKLKE